MGKKQKILINVIMDNLNYLIVNGLYGDPTWEKRKSIGGLRMQGLKTRQICVYHQNDYGNGQYHKKKLSKNLNSMNFPPVEETTTSTLQNKFVISHYIVL